MIITIRSLEGGWQVDWELELPEDEGLVRAILRAVKTRQKKAEEAAPEDTEVTEQAPALAEMAPEVPAMEAPDAARPIVGTPEGYRGFLLIRCRACGNVRGFNVKEPLTSCRCKICGGETELQDLREALLHCPSCERTWRYQTNAEGAEVLWPCINCGERLTARWNRKLRKYTP